MLKDKEIRKIVVKSLTNAMANGWGLELNADSVLNIAIELCKYTDFADLSPEDLIPFVQNFKDTFGFVESATSIKILL